MRRVSDLFTEGERRTLAVLFASVAILHLAGWTLCFASSDRSPAYLGLGWLAYSLGMRHAFDADHIAAIDNVTRKLGGDTDRPPLSVGSSSRSATRASSSRSPPASRSPPPGRRGMLAGGPTAARASRAWCRAASSCWWPS